MWDFGSKNAGEDKPAENPYDVTLRAAQAQQASREGSDPYGRRPQAN